MVLDKGKVSRRMSREREVHDSRYRQKVLPNEKCRKRNSKGTLDIDEGLEDWYNNPYEEEF